MWMKKLLLVEMEKKRTLFDSYPNLSEHAIFSLVGIFVIV